MSDSSSRETTRSVIWFHLSADCVFDHLPMGGRRHVILVSPPRPVPSPPLHRLLQIVSQAEIPAEPSIQLNFLSVMTAEGLCRCLKLTEDIASEGVHLPVVYTYRSCIDAGILQRILPTEYYDLRSK